MSLTGFLSWDVSDCHVDLEEELNTITQHAPEGEEARHGKSNVKWGGRLRDRGVIQSNGERQLIGPNQQPNWHQTH